MYSVLGDDLNSALNLIAFHLAILGGPLHC